MAASSIATLATGSLAPPIARYIRTIAQGATPNRNISPTDSAPEPARDVIQA